MKLGTLKSKKNRDGELILVTRDLKRAVRVGAVAPSMISALENWATVEPQLRKMYDELQAGKSAGAFDVNPDELAACLPRTYLFADGSAFVHHIKLVRMARKAALPETLLTVPLMYQAESANFLAPREDIPQIDFAHGTDFEGEVGVITDFVRMGSTPEQALRQIRLVVLINDVSLRGLIPAELASGFGFFQSKPAKTLSPFALTPDELGAHWKEGKVHLPLRVDFNGQNFGRADAGQMQFDFGQLIAHAAKTRHLMPGTIIGSGTVANEDPGAGSSCIVEKRTLEQINEGQPKLSYMKVGDTVKIEMHDHQGGNLFGTIFQKVAQFNKD
jgi:fumarylacetoacetate (FAA) hydrolase